MKVVMKCPITVSVCKKGGGLYCTVLYCTVCCSVRGGSRHLLPPADPHLPAAHPHHAPLLPLLRRASGPGQHQLRVILLSLSTMR